MKRAAAFIFSLVIFLAQLMASAQTLSANATIPGSCGCCVGKRVCCCLEESNTPSSSLPSAAVTASVSVELNALVARAVIWSLPNAAVQNNFCPSDFPLAVPAVPLFQRNCALLI